MRRLRHGIIGPGIERTAQAEAAGRPNQVDAASRTVTVAAVI